MFRARGPNAQFLATQRPAADHGHLAAVASVAVTIWFPRIAGNFLHRGIGALASRVQDSTVVSRAVGRVRHLVPSVYLALTCPLAF